MGFKEYDNMLKKMGLNDYIDLIENNRKFQLARYGDGEWACIFGDKGQNAQGGEYTEKLSNELRATLKNPRFTFFGTMPWYDTYRPEVKELISKIGLWIETNTPDGITWVSNDTVPDANVRGTLGPFIRVLRKKKVMLIGPPHLADLKIFKPRIHITVPLPGAQNVIDETVAHITALARNVDIICFSSGMATNVVMHKIMLRMEDNAPSMMDTGSVFDPYVGVWSRYGYRKERFQKERLPMNIKGSE